MSTQIDKRLLEKIRDKTGLKQSTVYAQIARIATKQALSPQVAALNLARENGININRFASHEDLLTLRGAVSAAPPLRSADAPLEPNSAPSTRRNSRHPRPSLPKRRGNAVFVVHGRNEKLRKSIFAFLRATGVQPIEWSRALSMTKKASPYVGEVLETAFSKAQAVVALLTPDDEARLKTEFRRPSDPDFEKTLTGQARPNVLFEAGMAFGTHPNQTVIVEVGDLRPFSDTYGRHVVHLDNSVGKRQELMIKLQNAGCHVDFAGTDWQTEGDFNLS